MKWCLSPEPDGRIIQRYLVPLSSGEMVLGLRTRWVQISPVPGTDRAGQLPNQQDRGQDPVWADKEAEGVDKELLA